MPASGPQVADAVIEAEFNMRDGVAFLEFERTAPSLQDAVASAIDQVAGSGVGARVVRVETEAANTIATRPPGVRQRRRRATRGVGRK